MSGERRLCLLWWWASWCHRCLWVTHTTINNKDKHWFSKLDLHEIISLVYHWWLVWVEWTFAWIAPVKVASGTLAPNLMIICTVVKHQKKICHLKHRVSCRVLEDRVNSTIRKTILGYIHRAVFFTVMNVPCQCRQFSWRVLTLSELHLTIAQLI